MPVRNHPVLAAVLRRGALLCCMLIVFGLAAPALDAQIAPPPHAISPVGQPTLSTGANSLHQPLLPPAFAGQPREGDVVIDQTPATVDAAHAAVLKEDGMVQAARARYGSGARAGWTVQAIRFGDVTGAYSAFTFYRTPRMQPERIGDGGAAGPGILVARRGATVVIARAETQQKPNGESILQPMKVLVDGLPRIYGPEAIPPTVPNLLPHDGLDKRSIRYALGPAGYSGPLPAGILGFQADAEVASGQYRLPDGKQATLTLSMLPTPQLASELIKDLSAMPDATVHLVSRRYGSLVGVVTGVGVPGAEAETLLGDVHYAPQVSMDVDVPPGVGGAGSEGRNPVAQMAQLLVGIAEFTILMAVCSIVLAGFFGFGRVYIRRLRGKPDSSLYDEEFITLKLK